MHVTDVSVIETPRGARLSASVSSRRTRDTPEEIEFVYRGVSADAVSTPGDALLATVLQPAMAAGEDVRIDAPVSERLLENVGGVIDTWSTWRPRWRRS